MEGLADWFRWLYDATGINFTIFYDPYDGARMLDGFLMSAKLGVICVLGSIVIGVVGAWMQMSHRRSVRAAVGAVVMLFRNTPPLVQIYFFYFGLGTLLPAGEMVNGVREPLLNNVQWAVLSLSLFAGAFNIEIFRSGIEAVPHSTIEAAESLGFSRFSVFVLVILPLAFRTCLPALNNNLVNLVKTTTLAYAIAVPEMLYMAKQIWSEAQNVTEMMMVLLVGYVGLVALLVWVMHRWERWMRIPGYGR